jgi:hypothetical protein
VYASVQLACTCDLCDKKVCVTSLTRLLGSMTALAIMGSVVELPSEVSRN